MCHNIPNSRTQTIQHLYSTISECENKQKIFGAEQRLKKYGGACFVEYCEEESIFAALIDCYLGLVQINM